MPRMRAAVVVAVGTTGGLVHLESAVSGAHAVADWLTKEGFNVSLITDAVDPSTGAARSVGPSLIADAVKTFVDAGTYDQLIIYFSGHGYLKNDAELWLLSDAPSDANAAVSWIETAEFAKDCGIPHVVLISDACRTIPTSVQALRVRGSIIFPNDDVQRRRAKIDKFMASALGRAAYEAQSTTGKSESVFTHCMLNAFKAPDATMIRHIQEDGTLISVVPNRQLDEFLQREVPLFLARHSLTSSQVPEAEILSDVDAYIGKALGKPRSVISLDRAPEAPPVRLSDAVDFELERALESPGPSKVADAKAIEELSEASGFLRKIQQASQVAEVSHFETETGYAVIGAVVADAIAVSSGFVEVLAAGDQDSPAVIRVMLDPTSTSCSVLVRYSNGRASILAALRGYIGHVIVDGNQVVNVSYVPSNNSWRWFEYEQRRTRIDRLRATVAAAVRMGVFRLGDAARASKLANFVRSGKALDPALGLFAAYAYSEADRREDASSVRTWMRRDLDVDLFDVAMLSRKVSAVSVGRLPDVVPVCPLLTQGWNFLRSRGVELPPVLEDAQDELEPSLWTTFMPTRAELLFNAIRGGEIQ